MDRFNNLFCWLQVLFLGCGDLMDPLTTAVGAAHNLNMSIHINDNSLVIIARNILTLKIITSQQFSPESGEDMGYVWDLWYNAAWPESTCKRFKEDVKGLLDNPLPDNIVIPDGSYLEEVKQVWSNWLATIETVTVDDVLADR